MPESKIAAAVGNAGLSRRGNNRLLGREIDLAVREAILQAAADGVQDPELIRHRMLQARQRVKDKYA
jgi:hypothetical protein